MIKYIFIALLMLPCATFAETNCNVIEYPDHNEVDCSGEGAVPKPPALNSPPALTPPTEIPKDTLQAGKDDSTSTDTNLKPTSADPAGTSKSQVQTPSQTPQPSPNQGTILNRQGRQQYQQSLDDAKAARRQMILDKQLQTAPPATATPSTKLPN